MPTLSEFLGQAGPVVRILQETMTRILGKNLPTFNFFQVGGLFLVAFSRVVGTLKKCCQISAQDLQYEEGGISLTG